MLLLLTIKNQQILYLAVSPIYLDIFHQVWNGFVDGAIQVSPSSNRDINYTTYISKSLASFFSCTRFVSSATKHTLKRIHRTFCRMMINILSVSRCAMFLADIFDGAGEGHLSRGSWRISAREWLQTS